MQGFFFQRGERGMEGGGGRDGGRGRGDGFSRPWLIYTLCVPRGPRQNVFVFIRLVVVSVWSGSFHCLNRFDSDELGPVVVDSRCRSTLLSQFGRLGWVNSEPLDSVRFRLCWSRLTPRSSYPPAPPLPYLRPFPRRTCGLDMKRPRSGGKGGGFPWLSPRCSGGDMLLVPPLVLV